ncbi:AAA family ATPase [Rubinisphaera sp.]|uniref:AAA family ATPase n=1 Tax=Rubinisphaera sp. TaxID=2024857 RepID=UPI000C118E3E|nr:AAA family ATPase [Rubinisphaera sp.]MBV10028.1 hypothetical protein [Rubinisphaera sp.]HCS51548.1 hypothetical protein [Planctomycetaceae bacterium]|tara:strand:- start:4537 stop:6834 length:2298 start_codon:yes stop_codon:yes gene_type:complete
MKINFEVLDEAVKKTIRPYLINQGALYDPKNEGYHHKKIIPNAQPHLTEQAIQEDVKTHLKAAFDCDVNLLSHHDKMPVQKFITEADPELLKQHLLDLLFGKNSLEKRIQDFFEWSKMQKGTSQTKSGINPTCISYLLSVSNPKEYAYCKPSVYEKAAKALDATTPLTSSGKLDKVARLVHATEFYKRALRAFQKRHKLPFEDLMHVHIAFFVMSESQDGYPDWKTLLKGDPIIEVIPHELNTILYGPPGTGKTYQTISRAVQICDGSTPESRDDTVKRYQKLLNDSRIAFVTFHQSYSYEDFVEGIRPILNGEVTDESESPSNAVQYECRPGIFKKMCSLAKSSKEIRSQNREYDLESVNIWKMSLGNKQKSEDIVYYEACIDENCLLLGYGGEIDFSDCHSISAVVEKYKTEHPDISDKDYAPTAVNSFKNGMTEGDIVVISDGLNYFRAIGRIIGEYKFLDETATTRMRQMRPVEWLAVYEESLPVSVIYDKNLSQMTIYQLNKKHLKLAALQDRISKNSDQPKNHVLIIDEINRGNVAKILGELITLLEPDKRIGKPNELLVRLPYSNDSFGVPSNLYILGTMNTADRSIAFLDVALRRRFVFEELMPQGDIIRDLVGEEGVINEVDVALLLEQINGRIEFLYDRDHQIGHAFLLNVTSLLELRDVFCHKIIPLLQEYFYGDWRKICMILGCPLRDSGTSQSSTSAMIHSYSLLGAELFGNDADVQDEKHRCEIDKTFASTQNEAILNNYFLQVIGDSETV